MFLPGPRRKFLYCTGIDSFESMRAMWDGHVYPTWERGSLAFPKASLFVAEGELAKWIEHIIRGHSLPTMHAAHGLC